MPVIRCGNGKWRIGNGPCMYRSKEKAQRAYVAYLAKGGDEEDKVSKEDETKKEDDK